MEEQSRHRIVVIGGGVAAAISAGVAMVPLREELGTTNAALVLAAIVVLGAEFGGSLAAIIVGIAAATVFNVLHTEPYHVLLIDDPSDVIAFLVLASFGLLLAFWRRR